MNGERWKPVVFVIATLALWWIFGTAGYVVVKCIPGGDGCPVLAARNPVPPAAASAQTPAPQGETTAPTPAAPAAPDTPASEERSWWPSVTRYDWLVFLSLLTAVWAAKVAVYPYESEPA